MKHLIIYGATGYTGRLTAKAAHSLGLPLLIAGRNAQQLEILAKDLGVATRVFALDDPDTLDAALSDCGVLLNCAGPYLHTAEPLMHAAIRNGVHYLDVSAELNSYLLAQQLDASAATAGVMLLPGSGGSVAILGSLAGHVIKNTKNARKIAIALHVSGTMSRGSAISASENMMVETLVCKDGKLQPRTSGHLQMFDFGNGPVSGIPLTLPDLITLWQATRIPDIETYVHVSGDAFPNGNLADLPDGPSETERQANRYQAAVEITDMDGSIHRARLDTVNGYSFTPLAAAEAARRVLAGTVKPGFQTPLGLFGSDFAETIADTQIMDV
ncbi:saccharopine dehydrogenase family protein [Thalassospira xianhensis]|uniref:Membrane protein n=1 Tax=Thalassospira xianhensis MCCC 1A02616 TaxID=1177929 RepID=A0A367UAX1_9PROT|nr:saccharopine dehydrogenase NADP-binding domain-containing protein [Thalassospira xianhensis]RCK04863.1 membrane protein [Thalassospira xianhensis MCCC 1A02616]